MNFTDEQLSNLLLDLCAPECAILGEPGAVECLLHLHHSPEAANFLERMEEEPGLRAAFRKIQDDMGEVKLGEGPWRSHEDMVPEDGKERPGIVVGGFGFAEDRLPGPCETYLVEALEPIENLSVSLTDFGDRVLVEITSPEECGAVFAGKVVRWRIGTHLGELSLKAADFDSVKASVYVNEPWSAIVAVEKELKRFWLLA